MHKAVPTELGREQQSRRGKGGTWGASSPMSPGAVSTLGVIPSSSVLVAANLGLPSLKRSVQSRQILLVSHGKGGGIGTRRTAEDNAHPQAPQTR